MDNNLSYTHKFYDTGDVIYLEYESAAFFYMILYGSVKIFKVTKNSESLVDIDYHDDFFGEMAILDDTLRSACAIAAEPTVLLEFKKESFPNLLTSSQTVAVKTLSLFVDRVSSARRKLLILQLQEPDIRIYDCLLAIAESQNISRSSYSEHQELYVTLDTISSYCAIDIRTTEKIIANLVRADKLAIISNGLLLAKNLNDFQRIIDAKRKPK